MKTRFFISVFICIAILLSSSAVCLADVTAKDKEKKAKGGAKKPAAEAVEKDDDAKDKKKESKDTDKKAKKSKGKKKAESAEKKPAQDEAKEKPEPKADDAEAKPADAKKDEAEKAKPEAPPTVEVKKETFSIEVKLTGVFAAKNGTEIEIDPKAWAAYQVLEAADHGKKVKKGELLIACDPEQIDEAIENAKRDFAIADLEFKQKTAEYELAKKFTPMQLAELKRSRKWSKEDEAYFWETTLPFEKESIEQSFEYAKFNLEYTKEELRQLEKMYGEDELTEETEEIILKRARQSVERAEFSFRMAKARYERNKSTFLPRDLLQRKEMGRRQEMAYQVAEKVFPMAVKQRELEMAKAKIAHQEAKEKLAELCADRKLMTVKAPCAGIVYYGKCIRGKWANASTVAAKLQPNGKLSPKETLMTILADGPMRVEADFTEKELLNVSEGIKGSVKAAAYPDMKLEGIVAEVVPLPSTGTAFHATINLARHSEDAVLRPGMTCGVELTSYEKENALTLPPNSVKTDEKTDKPYVYVVKEGEEPKRKEITVGRKNDKAVEILKGLAEGDKVLASPPNGDDKEKKEESAAKKPDAEKPDAEKKAPPKNGAKKS